MSDRNVRIPGQLDFNNIKTYPVKERKNLVTTENMACPGRDEIPEWGDSDFDELIERIIMARKADRPVIWSSGCACYKKWNVQVYHRVNGKRIHNPCIR